MNPYSSIADDHYINMSLGTEMELPSNRETVLHFFEQIQKKYPQMRNFYGRDKRDYVLEEDKGQGSYRWCSVETRRIHSGRVNSDSIEGSMEQHFHVLELAPYLLSISPLDCESLDLMMGFDFSYRGNHNELIFEALGTYPAFDRIAGMSGATLIQHEPNLTIALDDECRVQCRVSIEPRTNAYQIRTGEFQEEQLSVFVTARQYGSLPDGKSYVETLEHLSGICSEVVDSYVIDAVLEPLARTISMK